MTAAPKPLANRPAETGGAIGAIATLILGFTTKNAALTGLVGAVVGLIPAAITQVRGWLGKS